MINIKRIIREELEAVLDSFYLIVSEDEKFIYRKGFAGGGRWESTKNLTPKEIINSGFREYSEPEVMISRMNRGLLIPKDQDTKIVPKIVPVDFIIKKREETFPIMESNELDWIKDIQPFSSGEHFNEDSICFHAYSTNSMLRNCEVLIDDKSINFTISTEKFAEKFWKSEPYHSWEDESWILEPLISMGTPYDGNGDWHEFDSDEFNYSYYHIGDQQKVRFNSILRDVGSDEIVNNFEDTMLDLTDEFKYPKLQFLFNGMIDDYLNVIGYIIQKNRWLSVSHKFDSLKKESRTEWNMAHNEITIKIPIKEAYKYYDKNNVNNLTDLFIEMVGGFAKIEWYEWFYDEWDIGGDDDKIYEVFNDFLDSAEEYLESEHFEKWEKVLSEFEKLGVTKSTYWYTFNRLVRVNPNDDTIWVITLKKDFNEADLSLYKYKTNDSYYYGSESLRKITDVPLEEISKYIKPLV